MAQSLYLCDERVEVRLAQTVMVTDDMVEAVARKHGVLAERVEVERTRREYPASDFVVETHE
jgi:hypothetical protein